VSLCLSNCDALDRGFSLWAAHVRTNHVHVVVEADVRPEKIMNALKSYASRGLKRLGIEGPREAIRYVVSGQGKPMELYLGDLL
jgi:REP element-mobilizing transposase RayT